MLDKKKYNEFYLKTFKSEIRFHPKSRLAAPGYTTKKNSQDNHEISK